MISFSVTESKPSHPFYSFTLFLDLIKHTKGKVVYGPNVLPFTHPIQFLSSVHIFLPYVLFIDPEIEHTAYILKKICTKKPMVNRVDTRWLL